MVRKPWAKALRLISRNALAYGLARLRIGLARLRIDAGKRRNHYSQLFAQSLA
jgi:hypothetical protein